MENCHQENKSNDDLIKTIQVTFRKRKPLITNHVKFLKSFASVIFTYKETFKV